MPHCAWRAQTPEVASSLSVWQKAASQRRNGALPAPTLSNLDADPDLEVVLNTAHSGLVAYDLPGTANARVLWGTGRGNYQRTASRLGYVVYLPLIVRNH